MYISQYITVWQNSFINHHGNLRKFWRGMAHSCWWHQSDEIITLSTCSNSTTDANFEPHKKSCHQQISSNIYIYKDTGRNVRPVGLQTNWNDHAHEGCTSIWLVSDVTMYPLYNAWNLQHSTALQLDMQPDTIRVSMNICTTQQLPASWSGIFMHILSRYTGWWF